jgi:hypothetical protein
MKLAGSTQFVVLYLAVSGLLVSGRSIHRLQVAVHDSPSRIERDLEVIRARYGSGRRAQEHAYKRRNVFNRTDRRLEKRSTPGSTNISILDGEF